MPKKNIFFFKILICVFFILNLSGCWNAREVNDLEIVVGVGVDKAQIPNNVRIIAQIVKADQMSKASQDGGGGDSSKAYWDVTNTGKTVFEAVRNITHKTGRRLFLSHSQIVVFGSEIASEGLEKYLDFFLRSHEMRPTALILVSKTTAEEILDTKPEKETLPSMTIAKLVNSYGFTSQYQKVNLQDFSECLISPTTAPVAPLVEISKDKEYKDHYVVGMAVFKKDKMTGTLNQIETRGLLWVKNDVKSGVIVVNTPNEQGEATLEILKAKTKVTPKIKDGKVYMDILIKVDASLAEQTTSENLATVSAFKYLEKKLQASIKQEVLDAFEKSKELNSDIFGFGDMIHKKHPKEWKTMEDKWANIYPTISLNVNVEAKMRKTDLITKPVTHKGDEE